MLENLSSITGQRMLSRDRLRGSRDFHHANLREPLVSDVDGRDAGIFFRIFLVYVASGHDVRDHEILSRIPVGENFFLALVVSAVRGSERQIFHGVVSFCFSVKDEIVYLGRWRNATSLHNRYNSQDAI